MKKRSHKDTKALINKNINKDTSCPGDLAARLKLLAIEGKSIAEAEVLLSEKLGNKSLDAPK